jgi:hypothetical protein
MTETRDHESPPDPEPGNPQQVNSTIGSGCYPAAVWGQVCAADPAEDVFMDHLRHASTCRACSQLLAEALALGPGEATADEEATLSGLPTGSAAGRQRLAQRMQEAARPGAVARPSSAVLPFPKRRLLWPVVSLSVAAAVVVAAFLLAPRLRKPSDASLIATAYDRHRPSELRIPGSSSVPLESPTRGAGSGAETSTELLEVKLRAEREFEKTPNNPQVRQTLGEIALVEHDGESARRQFEMAEALGARLPRLKFDLASAYFELAESSANPLDYARAIDLFSQYLQANPGDPVTLFDRGLCWERQSVHSEAVKDFSAALKVEKDPGWRQEIQRHLDRLNAQSGLANPAVAQPLRTPESLLALSSESPGDFENYLDVAGREWLPRRAASPATASALEKLATMGAGHDDLWLRDLLAAAPEPAASRALAQALQANARGDPDSALAAATTAAQLYPRGSAGFLRAKTESVYSLQRMGRSRECLLQAQTLLAAAPLKRYSWMRTQLLLEVSSCLALQGRNPAAIAPARQAAESAEQSRLPLSGLRAAGFLASYRSGQGEFAEAWQSATAGLAASYTLRGTDMRRYQFLDSDERIAATLGLPWTEAGLAEAAADAAQSTGNNQILAYALEGLGVRQVAVGDSAAATQSFARADRTLDLLAPGPTSTLYRADWQSDRSELVGAWALANELSFYAQYADLLRRDRRLDEASAKAWHAVRDSERLLAGIHSASERQAWQQNTGRAYVVLTRTLIDAGQAEAALRVWEWFQGAAFRPSAERKLSQDSAAKTALEPFPPQAAGALTLVFARLEGAYAVWAVSGSQPVQLRMLAASPELIEQEAGAFRRLCSDPRSSPQDIALLGGALNRDLLAPFAGEINDARTVQLDLDPALSNVPFAAIPTAAGPLGIVHPLVFLPAGWTFHLAHGAESLDTLPEGAHMLVLRQSTGAGPRIPEEYDESRELAERFPQAQLETARLWRSGMDVTLSGGESLNAVLTHTEVLHYVGHGLEEEQPNSASPATAAHSFNLEPGSMPRCRLAVLAACRTLSSREREFSAQDVSSFTRVLLAAGASHVVATLWDVDSRMTQKLVVRLYTELANHQSFSEALRRAQQSLQTDPSSSQPYFWSAFQLVGQPAASARGIP